jgi:hypothetical protein
MSKHGITRDRPSGLLFVGFHDLNGQCRPMYLFRAMIVLLRLDCHPCSDLVPIGINRSPVALPDRGRGTDTCCTGGRTELQSCRRCVLGSSPGRRAKSGLVAEAARAKATRGAGKARQGGASPPSRQVQQRADQPMAAVRRGTGDG